MQPTPARIAFMQHHARRSASGYWKRSTLGSGLRDYEYSIPYSYLYYTSRATACIKRAGCHPLREEGGTFCTAWNGGHFELVQNVRGKYSALVQTYDVLEDILWQLTPLLSWCSFTLRYLMYRKSMQELIEKFHLRRTWRFWTWVVALAISVCCAGWLCGTRGKRGSHWSKRGSAWDCIKAVFKAQPDVPWSKWCNSSQRSVWFGVFKLCSTMDREQGCSFEQSSSESQTRRSICIYCAGTTPTNFWADGQFDGIRGGK